MSSSRLRLTILGAVGSLFIILVAVSLFATSDNSREQPSPELPPAGQVEGRPAPALTTEQEDRVRMIAAADRRLAQLVGTSSLPTNDSEIAPWTDYDGDLRGGVIALKLHAPATISGEWLGLDMQQGMVNYTSYRYKATFEGVELIHVFVDLNVGSVVSLRPSRPATLVGEVIPIDPMPPQEPSRGR